MSSPKGPPSMQLNGMSKRPMMTPQSHRPAPEMQMPMTPHHEEIIRYIYENWSRVSQEVDHYSHVNGAENRGSPAHASYYQGSREATMQLKDFKAVDLDQYMQRNHQKNDPHTHAGP